MSRRLPVCPAQLTPTAAREWRRVAARSRITVAEDPGIQPAITFTTTYKNR